jgi:hypothetical protein
MHMSNVPLLSLLTDLEVGLRAHCQKLRVIEKLSGGAHLLFPGESSLAVRTYYPSDLEALQAAEIPHNTRTMNDDLEGTGTDDLEGLGAFQSAFRTTVVFFVLPHDVLTQQLDNPDSFLHRANRILHAANSSGTSGPQSCSSILTVPDTATAITALISIADAMVPAKRALRREFVERQRLAYFLPDDASGFPHPNADGRAASHAATAFREWAQQFEFPAGEADVLMRFMGTLENVVTGNDQSLAIAPVEERSKEMLHAFFESQAGGTTASRNVMGGGSSNRGAAVPQTAGTGQVNGPPQMHQGPSQQQYQQQQYQQQQQQQQQQQHMAPSQQAFAYQNHHASAPPPVQPSHRHPHHPGNGPPQSFARLDPPSYAAARPSQMAYQQQQQPQMAYQQRPQMAYQQQQPQQQHGPTPVADRRLMRRYM